MYILLTFFNWNLIVALVSSTLPLIESEWDIGVGNLPALFKPGPRIFGICLINVSEARKALYFLAEKYRSIRLVTNNENVGYSNFICQIR